MRYPDRSQQDARLLTYTSAALDRAIEVTGHPVVSLFISSTADDGTVFVYLEDVDSRGRVAYVTEGQLRIFIVGSAPAPLRTGRSCRTARSIVRPHNHSAG